MAAGYLHLKKFPNGNVDAIFNAFLRLPETGKFKLIEANADTGSLTFLVPISFWSWGENVYIQIIGQSELVEAEIRSECKLVTQIMDWGKNKRNVQRILNFIATTC